MLLLLKKLILLLHHLLLPRLTENIAFKNICVQKYNNTLKFLTFKYLRIILLNYNKITKIR